MLVCISMRLLTKFAIYSKLKHKIQNYKKLVFNTDPQVCVSKLRTDAVMQQNVCKYKASIVQMRIIANNTNAKAYYYYYKIFFPYDSECI